MGEDDYDKKIKLEEYKHMKLMESRSKCVLIWVVLATVAMIAVMLCFGILLLGAVQSADLMTRTSEATVGMRTDTQQLMKNVENYLKDLRTDFPANQDAVTIRHVLGIIENAHTISSTLSRLQPEAVSGIVGHVSQVMDRVTQAINQVGTDQISRMMVMMDHVQELVAGVTPAQMNKLVDGAAEVAEHTGKLTEQADRLNLIQEARSLVEEMKLVANQAKSIHQVTLGWNNNNNNK